jgi:lysyl-tRNA synthetase class 2
MDPIRLEKAKKLKTAGQTPYAATFPRSHKLLQAKELPDGTDVSIAGRIVLWRDMGKVTFATLQDSTGRLQIIFKENETGAEKYAKALTLLDLGDFIGVTGERLTTKTGELSVVVRDWTILTKALAQPPEKWHGLADQETAWRQRYLDLLSNREVLDRFLLRSRFLQLLREFYWSKEFIEVETPVLVNAASGALAKPFQTHHDAYDLDVFLRIAPETYLKECLVGGFDRVFEVARCFRNEGLDPSHLQDFTMVEHYAAYWDYTHNMTFTEELFSHVLKEMLGTLTLQIPDRDGKLVSVDFTPPWPRISVREAIRKASGIDINEANSREALLQAMKSQGIRLDVNVDELGYGSLVDQLYKKVARPGIVQPTFLTEHPIELSPLARRNDQNPKLTDRFQLVVGGWEIVNAYSELVDPVDQAQRFEEQAKASKEATARRTGKMTTS